MDWSTMVAMGSVGGFIMTAVITVWRVGFIIGKHSELIKADYTERMAEMEKTHDGKHNRIYERFDEYKNHMEVDLLREYVRKDVWEESNKGVAQALVNLDGKIDSLRELIKDRIK